jgi:hypothetical protein
VEVVMASSELASAIHQYTSWGLSVIPFEYQSKEPAVAWEKYQHSPPGEKQLVKWFGNGVPRNVGIVCGHVSGNFVVLDFEDKDLFWQFAQKWEALRGRAIHEETPVVVTSRGYHVYLKIHKLPGNQKFYNWEIRAEGACVVAPPSVHPNGTVYCFANPETDILQVDDISELGIDVEKKARVIIRDSFWADKALKGVAEGQRDDTCIRLAGHYKAKGLTCEETLTLLKAWAERCTPPFPHKDVEKCVHSSYGYLVKEAQTQAEALAEARRVALRWLELKDTDVIDVALAIVIANKAEGDPLWLLLVGASSTGKSEILRGIFGCQNVHPLGGFTANTFASGFEKNKASLLEALANHTTLVVKDFGSLLTMRREDRGIILQQLREIYDGQYRKDYGNGKVVAWKGTMGLLAACTSAIENYHAVIGELGNRYILYRCELELEAREKVALKALSDEGAETRMRCEIEEAFKNSVDNAPDANKVVTPENMHIKLAALSSIVAQLRSQVSRDPYDKSVNYMPDIEGPARLAKAFAKLGKGLAAIRGKLVVTDDEYKVICKVALDSVPRRRSLIIGNLTDLDWKGAKEISSNVGIPTITVNRELEDLTLLRVVRRELESDDPNEVTQTTPYKWRLNATVARGLEASGLMEVIRAC